MEDLLKEVGAALLIGFQADGFFWERNGMDNWKFGGNTFVQLFGELNKVIILETFSEKKFHHWSCWKVLDRLRVGAIELRVEEPWLLERMKKGQKFLFVWNLVSSQ